MQTVYCAVDLDCSQLDGLFLFIAFSANIEMTLRLGKVRGNQDFDCYIMSLSIKVKLGSTDFLVYCLSQSVL